MKVLFVGFGSIGKKHFTNLLSLVDHLEVHVLKPSPLNSVIEQITKQYFNYNEITDQYDAIFICNPTAGHIEALEALNNHSQCFFVEKPLTNEPFVDIKKLNIDLNKTYYIAGPLKFHGIFSRIRELSKNDIISVRAICSSYLPEWRSGVDYRKVYSSQLDQGGGVSIDLIHEIDYIVELFGFPIKVLSHHMKCSTLEIDCEDLAVYIMIYEDKIVELHLDYFGRVPQRQVQFFTNEQVILGDFLTNEIIINGVVERAADQDMYINEMKHFLKLYDKEIRDNRHVLQQGLEIIKLARGEANENAHYNLR